MVVCCCAVARSRIDTAARMLSRVAGLSRLQLCVGRWHLRASVSRWQQRSHARWRLRMLPICLAAWRSEWMRARAVLVLLPLLPHVCMRARGCFSPSCGTLRACIALGTGFMQVTCNCLLSTGRSQALVVVTRRGLQAQRQALAWSMRRWRIGSALRLFAERRASVGRRRRLLQAMLGWLQRSEEAAWKHRAEQIAHNLFWQRGQPRLLSSVFAAARGHLQHLHRARSTAIALGKRHIRERAARAALFYWQR